jgi:DNA-directed RNA polymerase subunit E'/Rpb7
MAQTSLYTQIKLETQITINANNLDSMLDDHLLAILKRKVEGNTVEVGVVVKVIRIVDYKRGVVSSTNFMAPIMFDLVYECLLCCPKEGLEIICEVQKFVKGYVAAKNGPVIAALQLSHVDPQIFLIENKDIIRKSDNRKLEKNNLIKVLVVNNKFNLGEKDICSICKLVDFANDNEIKRYENEQKLISNIDTNESVFI